MKIEYAQIEDMPQILELQKIAYRSEAELHNDFTIPPLTQTLEEIKNDFPNQIFLKAVINGKIIGSIRAYKKDETCYIGRLTVHPDYQNQVIGKKLMSEIEAIFKDAKRFELFTGHKSERNFYLYQKGGYKKFKTEKVNENLKLIYMEKFQKIKN
ncbi:MAG: GNAT family N-acetyltransferase [Candidatus Jordarchaeum sp.]|uniref:GNAT family N-acetyltransferase n=1 Tax=Candidatus Jordarchaeum sp. TaxID=2823881 RepID=UPI00404AB986